MTSCVFTLMNVLVVACIICVGFFHVNSQNWTAAPGFFPQGATGVSQSFFFLSLNNPNFQLISNLKICSFDYTFWNSQMNPIYWKTNCSTFLFSIKDKWFAKHICTQVLNLVKQQRNQNCHFAYLEKVYLSW